MQHPDEGTIHAWIDGELSQEEATALEAHLKECADCSALAAEARGLVAASSRIVSALDIVPGDVIPKAQPRRRAWYASTQLRAAAAVMIVAGASLLVLKNGGQNKAERAMQSSAPAVVTQASPEAKELDRVAPTAVPAEPVRVAAAPPAESAAPKPLAKKQSTIAPREEPEKALEGRVAGVAMSEAMTDAAKPVQPLQPTPSRDTTARRRFTGQLNEVVVTGVAVASEPRDLRKIRMDSAKNETVYEIRPGVEVTLTDNGEAARLKLRASTQSKARDLAASAPAPPPQAANAAGAVVAQATPIDSISWTSRQGHRMVLKGPLAREELEKIRQRLSEDQR